MASSEHRIMQRNPFRSCTGLLVLALLAGMGFLYLAERHPAVVAVPLLAIAAVIGLVGTWRQRRRTARQRVDPPAQP